MFNLIKKLFGAKVNRYELEIKFFKEAIYFGDHGTIVVSNIPMNMYEVPVRFAFVGLKTPPKLDQYTFNRIWEEAKIQGYVPHSLQKYGIENDTVDMSEKPESAPDVEFYKQSLVN